MPFEMTAAAYVLVAMVVVVRMSHRFRLEGRFDWFTNVPKLADGKGVGIDWTSSNLNNPWFGGSRTIPSKDICNGAAWRKLIVDGLMQASTGLCGVVLR